MIRLQKEGVEKLIIAKHGDRVAGYVFVYFNHQSAHFPGVQTPFLEDLMVHPDFLEKGFRKNVITKM